MKKRTIKVIASICYILWGIIFIYFVIRLIVYCMFFIAVKIAIDNGGINF